MEYNALDIIEYTVALVDEFAQKYEMSYKQAYDYIRCYNGITFIEQNYGIMHTLDFKETIESVAIYCRRFGGKL